MELSIEELDFTCEMAFEDGVQRGMLLAGMVVWNMQDEESKGYTLDDARRMIAGMMLARSKNNRKALEEALSARHVGK